MDDLYQQEEDRRNDSGADLEEFYRHTQDVMANGSRIQQEFERIFIGEQNECA